MLDMSGKVAIVTGATQGLAEMTGRFISNALCKRVVTPEWMSRQMSALGPMGRTITSTSSRLRLCAYAKADEVNPTV